MVLFTYKSLWARIWKYDFGGVASSNVFQINPSDSENHFQPSQWLRKTIFNHPRHILYLQKGYMAQSTPYPARGTVKKKFSITKTSLDFVSFVKNSHFGGCFFTNVIDFRPNFGRKSAENIFFGKSSWNWSENIYTIFKSDRYFFLNLWFCTPGRQKSFYEI